MVNAYIEITNAKYKEFKVVDSSKIHNGYFSEDKKKHYKDSNGKTKEDESAYSLIMRDKERLLDMNEPLRFIFSHSALKEGWDNPNVFQICTLNETQSSDKKRQIIGRGIRLAVNQEGERVLDPAINRLTLVANESYGGFAKTLQTEYEQDCGVHFESRLIKDVKKCQLVECPEDVQRSDEFQNLWGKIKHKTRYKLTLNTKQLIQDASQAIKALPGINAPKISVQRRKITMSNQGIDADKLLEEKERGPGKVWGCPDILLQLQEKTRLTRITLVNILIQSGRLYHIILSDSFQKKLMRQ